MARKINWEAANLKSKKSLSLKDEEEFRSRGRVATWAEIKANNIVGYEQYLKDKHKTNAKKRR